MIEKVFILLSFFGMLGMLISMYQMHLSHSKEIITSRMLIHHLFKKIYGKDVTLKELQRLFEEMREECEK